MLNIARHIFCISYRELRPPIEMLSAVFCFIHIVLSFYLPSTEPWVSVMSVISVMRVMSVIFSGESVEEKRRVDHHRCQRRGPGNSESGLVFLEVGIVLGTYHVEKTLSHMSSHYLH